MSEEPIFIFLAYERKFEVIIWRTFLFEMFTHVFILICLRTSITFVCLLFYRFMIECIKSKQSSLLSINVGSHQDQGLDSSTSSLATSLEFRTRASRVRGF